MPEYIIGVISRPPEQRDAYQEMALATGFGGYVRPDSEAEPQPGEFIEYVQVLEGAQLDEIEERIESGQIGNLRYIEPNGTVTTDELEVAKLELGEDAGPGAVPEAASLKYMGADGLTEDGWDGTGVRVAVGDGGTSRKWREVTGLVPKKTYDFVTGRTETHLQVEAGDTEHGCYVAPHCVPIDAEYYEAVVFNGQGSASWADVARFFRWCGDNRVDVANFSGSGDGFSQAIQDAVDYAVARGVVICASMGNDGRYTFNITPAGLRGVYSSGAANKVTDRRAGFSTHHEKMSGLAPGEREISYDAQGRLIRWSGTSGSSPNKAGLVVMGATKGNGKPGHSAQVVAQALVNTARDLPDEPVQEEGAGAWDLRKALAKLEPAPELRPEPTPRPEPPKNCGDKPRWRDYQKKWAAQYRTDKKRYEECAGQRSVIARILGR